MAVRMARILGGALLAFACIPFFAPQVAQAQAIGNFSPFTLSVNPTYPQPYDTLTVTPVSGTVNLSEMTVTVLVDGTRTYEGSPKSVSIPLKGAGQTTTVRVIASGGGTTYAQDLSTTPEGLALITEPVASAPALYLGKPLVPLGGSVRVVAVADFRTKNGAAIDPAALSYSWTVNGTTVGTASGVGKSSVLVDSPLKYRTATVSVLVKSPDGNLSSGGSVALSAAEPIVRIYENDPLLGVRFETALSGTYAISGTEASLFAVPFSFPKGNGGPLIRWFLNGAAAQTGPVITLRPTGNGTGTANLSLTAGNGSTVAPASLSLSFDTTRSQTNLLGL